MENPSPPVGSWFIGASCYTHGFTVGFTPISLRDSNFGAHRVGEGIKPTVINRRSLNWINL